jgi:hypothetical protein
MNKSLFIISIILIGLFYGSAGQTVAAKAKTPATKAPKPAVSKLTKVKVVKK